MREKPQTEVFGTTEIFMEDTPFSLEVGAVDELPPSRGLFLLQLYEGYSTISHQTWLFLHLYLQDLDAFSRSMDVAENTLFFHV